MRARARLAAAAVTGLALLGGTVACAGEAPGRGEQGINEELGEDDEGEGGDDEAEDDD